MNCFVIPCETSLPHIKFQTELDGTTYGLEFRWNERVGAWFMALYDVGDNLLIAPVRVTVGFPLMQRTRYSTEVPHGFFLAVDTSGQDLDPNFPDLGKRVEVLYYSVT